MSELTSDEAEYMECKLSTPGVAVVTIPIPLARKLFEQAKAAAEYRAKAEAAYSATPTHREAG